MKIQISFFYYELFYVIYLNNYSKQCWVTVNFSMNSGNNFGHTRQKYLYFLYMISYKKCEEFQNARSYLSVGSDHQ